MSLREEVKEALQQLGSHMNYGNFVDYQFAFEYLSHLGRDYLCIIEDRQSEKPQIMWCYHNQNNFRPVRMESEHIVWFHKVSYYSFLFQFVMNCDVISRWNVTEGLEQTKKSTRVQLFAQVNNTLLFDFFLFLCWDTL